VIVVVMGVSGSGKTTIGRALAQEVRWPYRDADDYHPPANVAKMAAGTPLDDTDRRPWLDKLNAVLHQDGSVVLGCSALKEAYRQRLTAGLKEFRIVYLHGSFELLSKRAAERQHRFMPASLLKSQFETLEPPRGAIEIDVAQPVATCVQQILAALPQQAIP
jgi:gluconokinase